VDVVIGQGREQLSARNPQRLAMMLHPLRRLQPSLLHVRCLQFELFLQVLRMSHLAAQRVAPLALQLAHQLQQALSIYGVLGAFSF